MKLTNKMLKKLIKSTLKEERIQHAPRDDQGRRFRTDPETGEKGTQYSTYEKELPPERKKGKPPANLTKSREELKKAAQDLGVWEDINHGGPAEAGRMIKKWVDGTPDPGQTSDEVKAMLGQDHFVDMYEKDRKYRDMVMIELWQGYQSGKINQNRQTWVAGVENAVLKNVIPAMMKAKPAKKGWGSKIKGFFGMKESLNLSSEQLVAMIQEELIATIKTRKKK